MEFSVLDYHLNWIPPVLRYSANSHWIPHTLACRILCYPPPFRSLVPANYTIKELAKKSKTNTKIALTQLDNIWSGIQASANTLVSLPSVETITEATHLIKTGQQTLASINQNVPLMRTWKAEVMKLLHCLEAHILEVDIISPSGPIEYDTGKLSASTLTSVTSMLVNHHRAFVS